MKKTLAALLICAMAASLTACSGGSGSPETTAAQGSQAPAASQDTQEAQAGQEEEAPGALHFQLAENQPDGNPITEGMYMFADLVKKYTDGTVIIDVYANAALCDEASSIDQVMAGTLDFSRVNTNSMSPVVDLFGAFGLNWKSTPAASRYFCIGRIKDSYWLYFVNFKALKSGSPAIW